MNPAPSDLVPVEQIECVTLPNVPAAHRLLDRLHDAQQPLSPAVNE